MRKKSIQALFFLMFLFIFFNGACLMASEGRQIGQVFRVDAGSNRVVVQNPRAAQEIFMGDKLYFRIDGKIVLLDVINPMRTQAICQPIGENRALFTQATQGLPVYRWSSDISDIDLNVVESVTLNKSQISINVGSSETLVATVLPDSATNKELRWTSSDDSVVSVSNTGTIRGLKAGVATIRVFTLDDNKEAECVVRVNARPSST